LQHAYDRARSLLKVVNTLQTADIISNFRSPPRLDRMYAKRYNGDHRHRLKRNQRRAVGGLLSIELTAESGRTREWLALADPGSVVRTCLIDLVCRGIHQVR
jgi:hypothetical protein